MQLPAVVRPDGHAAVVLEQQVQGRLRQLELGLELATRRNRRRILVAFGREELADLCVRPRSPMSAGHP